MSDLLGTLHHRLIVSCQPVPNGPMDTIDIAARMARAALAGGCTGLRVEGTGNVRAVRAVTDAPLIGLIKRDIEGRERISPWLEDVDALADAGADVIALDATRRPRDCTVESLVAAVHARGRLAMADCSDAEDGRAAFAVGADILGSTLSGYSGGPVPDAPDLALLGELAGITPHVFAEGRYNAPPLAAEAIAHGAWAVVVGSAITRVEHVTSWFADAIRHASDAR